ncbi:hypothetical protein [Ralstonia sp. RRA.1]|uniref:hypothetical protein n=1 Tax=Ralstonia sp. RRA TaxID=3122075 RepID=UPI0030CAAED6
MAVTDTHEEKETLAVDVLLPGHEARVTTALFTHTKKQLIEREGGRCFICNATAEESGHPLEAHHHPIERSLANLINWERVAAQAKAGEFARAQRRSTGMASSRVPRPWRHPPLKGGRQRSTWCRLTHTCSSTT